MTALRAAFVQACQGLRARRRRLLLTGLGIALAAAMLSAAVVVSYGLGTGFDRAASAAHLPDLIVRFNGVSADSVARRITALPDVAGYSLRTEVTDTTVSSGGEVRDDAIAEVVNPGRDQGYAVIAGRNLSGRGREVLLEPAFAQAWGVRIGSIFDVGGLGPERVVGFAEAPDNVGFPLAKPRYYLSRAQFGPDPNPQVNLAEIWLRNPAYLNEVLVQARATSFGLQNIQFATRSGVRTLLDQAAGIVIDLLVALSLIALVTAGVMLAASARAEVQRRLGAIGVRRAVGTTRGQVVLAQLVEGLIVAVPAATVGVAAGTLATDAPANRLLTLLNEPAPGWALTLPLFAAWLAAVSLPVAGAAWPAWRATAGPVVGLLRGADVASRARGGRTAVRRGAASPAGASRPAASRPAASRPAATRTAFPPAAGLTALAARLVAARRTRLVATALTLGLSTAFVLLMLALASTLGSLETDPGALGKRYQLTAYLPPSAAREVRRIPGVAAVAPRYEDQAADSFSLGETIDVIGYPGNHTQFEAPPLVSGHRLRGPREAEVGLGLADALGLNDGSTLALAFSSGDELRLRVAGIVSSLDHDGRVAYIPARAMLSADPDAPSSLAIVLRAGANAGAVSAALSAIGGEPTAAAGATARGVPLVDVLRTILRAIAIVDGLVCLYALVQACALTVQERRRTVAVVRACGAGPGAVRRLLAGAALALVVPAAIVGVLLERFVLGPALSHLAENYANLSLTAGPAEVFATLAGLAIAAGVAVAWVSRQASRESVVEGLAS
ncbi:MAG: FtsX-like permease family protein [Solirubrobacteraceae bacterium]